MFPPWILFFSSKPTKGTKKKVKNVSRFAKKVFSVEQFIDSLKHFRNNPSRLCVFAFGPVFRFYCYRMIRSLVKWLNEIAPVSVTHTVSSMRTPQRPLYTPGSHEKVMPGSRMISLSFARLGSS